MKPPKIPVLFRSGERKDVEVVYDGAAEHDALIRALAHLDAEHENED